MYSLRLVLVGKTGAGKSSTGNTILGKEEFKAGFSFNAVTAECQRGEGEVDGRTVTVVDTPGVTDLHVSMEDAKDRVAECFPMSAPGPHAFLLVIKLGRFTAEEKQAADVIREVFGEAALEHTIVLFTNGDQLEDPDDLEILLSGCEELTYLLDKVRWRYHVFNNKMDDRTQVIELLKKIDQMVGKRGRHYTRELFQVAEQKRKEEQEKERMRREMEKFRREWDGKPELRILLIGKTTKAIRTASDILLPGGLQRSETSGCQKKKGEVFGRRVTVVETPGLSDERGLKEIMHEIKVCICLTSPGPHAFGIVEEPGKSTERKDTLDMIKDVFGDQAVVYAFPLTIESSENPVCPRSNDSHSSEVPCLPVVTFHTRDNTYGHRRVTSLLQDINKTVHKNGGSFFTNEMYAKTEKAIIEAQMKMLEKRKSEIIKSRRVRWEEYENSEEWREVMLEARRLAELENRFVTAANTLLNRSSLMLVTVGVATGLGFIAAGPAGLGIGLAVGSLTGL